MSIAKKNAAEAALQYVESGMKLGLGTGSTAAAFVALLAEKVQNGLDVICVPTSIATQKQAEAGGISLSTLDALGSLDITIDGADEFDPALNLIKGGGGALLREKIVAASSSRMIVIADDSKKVDQLGAFPLPIEIIPFGAEASLKRVQQILQSHIGRDVTCGFRTQKDGQLFYTDENNLIIDAKCEAIPDVAALHDRLSAVTGVVEHGLFIDIAERILIGAESGVETLLKA